MIMSETEKLSGVDAQGALPARQPTLGQSPDMQSKTARPDVVVFKNVTKIFGHGPDAKVAIQDISFVVEDLPDTGELITIVGPSGCGKSTVLRTIASLKPHFPPTKGEVLVFGKPAHGGDDQLLIIIESEVHDGSCTAPGRNSQPRL